MGAQGSHFPDDPEPDTAADDEGAGDQVEQNVILIGDQAGAAAQDVEAGVVEGRHRMEDADADGLGPGAGAHKGKEAEHRARRLKDQGGPEDAADELHDAVAGVQVHGFPDHIAAFQVHAAAHEHDDAGAHRRDAQTAHLDEQPQDELSQGGEGIPGVHRDQAGHADGTGGGIQGIDVLQVHTGAHAAGQHEQHRAQQNGCGKAQGDDARGGKMLAYLFGHEVLLFPSFG